MERRYYFGEWVSASTPLTVDEVTRLCRKGAEEQLKLAEYPLDRILRLLGKVGDLWADPTYPRREFLEKHLPEETGFSSKMLRLAFEELVSILDPDTLRKKIEKELPSEYLASPRQYPLGVVLHVLSGNIFLVGAGSLVEGLLTKNVTILKAASGEGLFLPELIESILECDEDRVVSCAIALVDYSSRQSDVIVEFKKRVDGIVVWGGEQAVKAYREGLPARTRLIVFGPKLSLAMITRAGIARHGLEKLAETLAKEITIWDQNACTAPQLAFVEGEREACRLVDALAAALGKLEIELPAGTADLNTAVEIGKIRSVFEIAEARGVGLLRASAKGVDWTVVLDRDRTIEPSPLHRTLRVIPVQKIDETYSEVERLRGYIQTIGLECAPEEGLSLAHDLGVRGALRIVTLGQMAGGEIDDPHDGQYDLPQLVNLVVSRSMKTESGAHWLDYLPCERRRNLINERLRTLLDRARRSLFYAERLRGLRIDTVEDLPLIPSLKREEMENNMPPRGNALATGNYLGGYVTRSGGSTGEPKFSIYDGEDWETSIVEAVRIFEAAGLQRGDRLANCMLGGDLYGSFVSFDHINYRVGVTTFAFAGHVNPETFVDVWRQFQINAIEAVPTVLVPLVRGAKQIDPEFSIEKILYAGAPLSGTDYRWIKENLGTKRIASIIGANDGNQLAYQCSHMSGTLHHLIDDYNYVEIVDENGKRVPEGAPGKILITSLRKFAFPLIRYEIGDAGRIVPESCPCGRTSRVLEYLGRSDDAVCVGMMNVRYRDIVAALSDLPISALQLSAQNNEQGEFIALRIESSEPVGLKALACGALFSRVKRLKERVDDGSLVKIEFDIVEPGTLPRNPRTGKIKQVVDERR